MADEDVVMFRFSNNVAENAAEIAAGLNETIQSIHAAARQAGGTAVPVDFGSGIVKSVQKHADEASAILGKALDPRNLSSKASAADVRGEMGKVAVGAFQNIQREIDKAVAQLGPAAQRALSESGELGRIMDHVAHALVGEVMAGYENLRSSFDAQLRQQLPSVSRLGKIDTHLGRALGVQDYYLQPAAEQRAELISDPKTGDIDAAKYAAAEVAAEAARVRAATATTKEDLARAQRELSEALANMVGHEDPIARAMGLTRNPTTGLPTRRKGEGFEDITDPRQVTETLAKYDELKRSVAETKRLLSSGEVRQIGNSRFFQGNTGSLYENATTSGVQHLRLLDETETRVLSLRQAEEALRKERGLPDPAVEAEKRRIERLRQEERDANLANSRRAADARRVRGFIPGLIQGAVGSGLNATGALEPGLITANIGKTVGTAARYSLAYGGFYQFLQAMKSGIAIFADYQDSFTDFQVAMGSGNEVTQSTTNGLMELSRVVGENVGAAYDSAARGVRAFAANASQANKDLAAYSTASAAQKVSVIANKPLADATGDVIAIGSAYGMSATQAELQIPDAISNAKRTLGGDSGQISQGLANFAVTANLAGYNLQEAANVISLVQAKTDESGQAVATRLTRVIQILGGSTGKSLAGDVNRALGSKIVDTQADPKTQLTQFGRAYVRAGRLNMPELQSQITSQLGGTGNLKEILPILEASGQKRLADALKNAIAGAGQDEYQRKINTLSNTLVKLRGSLQNLVVLAANADLFAPFAAGVKVLDPTLHLLEKLLQVYEKLEGLGGKIPVVGGLLGPAGTMLAEATAAVYAFNKIRASSFASDVARNNPGLVGSVARAGGAGETIAAEVAAREAAVAAANQEVLVRQANVLAAREEIIARGGAVTAIEAEAVATGELAVAEEAAAVATAELAVANEASAAASVTMRAALGTVGAALLKIAPYALALAGLFGIQDFYDKGQKLGHYDNARTALLKTEGDTPKELSSTLTSLRTLAANQSKDLGWLNKLGNLFGTGPSETTTKRADEIASILKRVQRESDALGLAAEQNSTFGVAAARTVDSLSAAFQLLTEQGSNARQELNQYFKALMTPPKDTLGTGETPNASAARFTQQLLNSTMDALPKRGEPGGESSHWWRRGFGATSTQTLQNAVSKYFDMNAADKVLTEGIKGYGRNLTKAEVAGLGGKAFDAAFSTKGKSLQDLGDYPFKGVPAKGGLFPVTTQGGIDYTSFRKKVVDQYFAERIRVLQHQAHQLAPLTPAELQALLTAQSAALDQVDPGDPTARARQARENYLQLQARLNATGTPQNARRIAMREYDKRYRQDPSDYTGLTGLFGGAMRAAAGNAAFKGFGLTQVAKAQANYTMRDENVKEAEDARLAAESRVAKASPAKQAATRLKYAKTSFRYAGNEVTLIEQLMESMDRDTVHAVMDYRKEMLHITKLAYDKAQAAYDQAKALLQPPAEGEGPSLFRGEADPTSPDNILGGTVDPKIKAARDRAKLRYENRRRGVKTANEAYQRANIKDDSFPSDKLTAWQQRALLGQALGTPNDSVSQARHGLDVARANLDATIKNEGRHTSGYFSALQAVTQGRLTLATAVADSATAEANLVAARAGGGALATAKAQIQAGLNQLKLGGGKTERDNALASIASGHLAERQAEAGKVGAIAQANATRIGGGIANARAGLAAAAAMLRAQARGTLEWWQQYGNYVQAQQAMRDAALAYRNNLDLLHGDSTDPVEQARDAMRAAVRKQRQDRGRGKDLRTEDAVAVQDTRNALEKAKFDQRFSDMQTAEDNGRLSFSKWMSYLDHEHERLTKIKHRTRQQQDELDQVDKAMKDALNSMDSQFNLGDINTNGLVYQVRRFKAEMAGGGSTAQLTAPAATTHQTVSISINGADTAKVKTIIDGYLRIGGGRRQALTRRKV